MNDHARHVESDTFHKGGRKFNLPEDEHAAQQHCMTWPAWPLRRNRIPAHVQVVHRVDVDDASLARGPIPLVIAQEHLLLKDLRFSDTL